ncbi:MAG: DUF1659 domain-containing protein [Thermoanaerobacteraceae bacterium]|nr:DUF1659 domain-containing protein [Thermoanaerobacteraceae bacterium]
MAVVSNPIDSSMRLVFQTGTDAAGNPQFDDVTYRRVKPTATDQDVFDVANIIAGLQVHTLNSVQRINENELAQSATA